MSDVTLAGQPGTAQQAAVAAALVVLERMGLSPADLVAALRCLYQRAAADGLIAEADNPACAGCASWPSTRSAPPCGSEPGSPSATWQAATSTPSTTTSPCTPPMC